MKPTLLPTLALAMGTSLLWSPSADAQGIRRSGGETNATAPDRSVATVTSPARAQAVLPRIALLRPDRYSNHADDEDMAYERLGLALANLGRFTLVERGRIDAILRENQLGIDGLLRDQRQLNNLTAVDYLVEIHVSNETMSQSGQGRNLTYLDQWVGSCRLIDVRQGIVARAFGISASGSGDTMGVARGRAADAFVADALQGFREVFRLQARIVGRQGKLVQIDVGSDKGMQPGFIFSARRAGAPILQPGTGRILETPTSESGQIVITRTWPGAAEGVILEGAGRIQDQDLLVEVPAASLLRTGLAIGLQQQPYRTQGTETASGVAISPRFQAEGEIIEPYSGQGFGVTIGGALLPNPSGLSTYQVDFLAHWKLPLSDNLHLRLQGGFGLDGASQPLKAPVPIGSGTASSASASQVSGVLGASLDLRILGPLALRAGFLWRPEWVYQGWGISPPSNDGDQRDRVSINPDALSISTAGGGGLMPQVGISLQF
ncbi:MAG: CsgG/HfaB family protein [Candidatus Sericytochromatia bacterium]|nr:CsgG/HfaB family protein [Candidatus Sericytochromatia bacterium]